MLNAADSKRFGGEWYRKGVEAMEKKNWDLAVEMFGMCAKFIPDNVMYRQLLRNCECKKYNDNKTGAGTLAKSKLLGIRSRIKKARSKEDWGEVDKACEEGLVVNPWDVQLNVDLAEAAKRRELMDVARFALMTAWSIDQNNKQLSWSFAELLEERGEYDEASKVWQHICKLDPNDGTARSKLTGSQTKKTLDRGGYESASGTREVMMNRGPAGKGAEAVAPGESQEADFKHAIRKEPEKVENYLKLADLYKREHRLEEAHAILEKGVEVSGNDPNVRELLEDIELARMKESLEKAKERAAQGDETARKQAPALSQEYNKRRLEVLSRRVERYPQDLTLKFELGELLMAFAKWPQAIPLLQQASQNKRIKVKALALLGRCFMADKKLPLAKGQLERAVAELAYDDDPKLFLQTYYNLATVCETLGETTAAENYYGEILVRDYEYKDARQRLEKLQGGGADEES